MKNDKHLPVSVRVKCLLLLTMKPKRQTTAYITTSDDSANNIEDEIEETGNCVRYYNGGLR